MNKKKIKFSDLLRKNRKRAGLVCPKCGCADWRDEAGRPWQTTKTVNMPGAVRRYKICRHCGRRVRTKEIIDSG